VTTLVPVDALAQQSDMNPAGSVTMGPLGVVPRIQWRTEYDDNLYRSSVPISDLVSTIGGGTDLRARMRRVGLSLSGTADWVHYRKLTAERGANADGTLRLDLLFTRLTPYVTTSYRNSRNRLNLEIDTRPRSQHSSVGFGSIVQLGGKAALDVSASRARVAYGATFEADGVVLRDALNRVSNQVALKLLQQVTPLTQIHVTSELSRFDFDIASPRNADTVRILGGFESTGVINGYARAGIRILKPRDPSLPESRGTYLSVGTTATIRDRVQIGVDAQRDVAPSYRRGVAYYEFYGYGASISCAVARSLTMSMLVSQRVSDYRTGLGNAGPAPDYLDTDRETRYGSTIRYQLGQSMAIDVSGIYAGRTSTLASRRFDGRNLTVGVSHAF
jgi:hypothetical protein